MSSRVIAIALTAALAALISKAEGQEAFESPPILRASELLAASTLRGVHHQIAEEVFVSDSKLVFVILTPFGRLRAHGLPMLEVRLNELSALHRMNEMSGDRPLLDGAWQSLADTPKGAGLIVTDPIGSLERMPKGLGMMVMSRVDRAERKAGPPLRRWLADAVGCDPETNNHLLAEQLDWMTQRKLAGKLIGRIGMSAPVPGLGLLSLTADIKKMTLDQPPRAINLNIDEELRQNGVTAVARDAFRNRAALTTTQRLILLEHYRAINEIPGRAHLIDAAASADDEAQGLASLLRVKMMAHVHRVAPIRSISYPALPVASLVDGRAVVVFSDDLLFDSSEWRSALQTTRAAIKPGDSPAILLIAGRVTIRAKAMAERLGFIVMTREDWAGQKASTFNVEKD